MVDRMLRQTHSAHFVVYFNLLFRCCLHIYPFLSSMTLVTTHARRLGLGITLSLDGPH